MRRGQYASTEYKSAPLCSDFARQFLGRHFSSQVVEALYAAAGTYSRGPRKGKTKGTVTWVKVIEGGWYRDEPQSFGRVVRPGSIKIQVEVDNRLVLDVDANASDENRIKAMHEIIAMPKRRF